MPYSAEISRANPSCFVFVIDQSGSMADPFPTPPQRKKCDLVADAINKLLQNLCLRCAKEEGLRDYFHVSVIGYGSKVGAAFSGPLAGKEIVPVSEIGNSPARVETRTKKVEDGAGGLVDQSVRFPIWFDPMANGGTPMCQALSQAQRILENWLAAHPDCFPPVVIHITDGESSDGDPSGVMQQISSLASSDGNVMLFNLHISASQTAAPVEFPDNSEALNDPYAQTLFNGSSTLTPFMVSVANSEHGMKLTERARGFVMNASPVLIIQALDIGTRPSNLR